MSFCARNATIVSCLGLAVWCGAVKDARASGFALREQSAEGLGDAFAGQSAKAYNASTVFYNPAGMSNLDSNEFAGTTTWIAPVAQFKGSNSLLPSGSVSGRDNTNAIKSAAIGSAFGVWSASPDWKFGASVATPFGMRSDYKPDWVGRYQALHSDVTDVDVSIVASYKIDDHLSVGGGPRIDYLKATLSQAVNFNTLGLATASSYVSAAQAAAAAAAASSNPAQAAALAAQAASLASSAQTAASWGDGLAKVEGDDIGVGYNLGALYEFDSKTRLGLDYRSRSSHTLSGTVNYQAPSTLSLAGSTANLFVNQNATAKITLPDSVNLGGYHEIDDRWAVLASAEWTDWGLFKQLNVVGANGQAISSTQENWHDTWFLSLGTNFKATDKWTLHGGVAFDQSPVRDAFRTARIPDSNRYWLATGASYAVTPAADIHIGYTHIFADKASIQETAAAPLSGTLTGSYSNSVDIVSTSFALRF
jgi:long-chain fatty acid transport protein